MRVWSVLVGVLLRRVFAGCHSSCRTCLLPGMDISCTSCYSNAHTQFSTASYCLCEDGLFPSPEANNCVPCHPDCLGCSSPAQSDCYSCPAGSHLSGSAPSACECDIGYPNPDAAHCTPCDLTCLTCSGLGPNACVTCRSLAQISMGQCVCKAGYYPNPTSVFCYPCFPTCTSCTDAMPSNCLSCPSHAQLVGGSAPSACECVLGYYLSPDSTSCLACDSSCSGCAAAGPNWCLGCYSGASLYGPSPSACICDSTTFPSPNAGSCTLCSPLCLTCVGKAASACSSCKSHASLTASAPSSCVCDFGYYPNTDVANCQACHPACLSCSGSGSAMCQTCQLHASISGSAPNVCTCDSGYFPNPHAGKCSSCDLTCDSCLSSGPTGCSSCKPHAAVDGSGACKCDNGYYLDLTSGFCLPCDSTCQTCSSSSFLGCLSCQSHAHLSLGSPDQCVCDSGYYPNLDSSNCALCNSFCNACLDSTVTGCISCKSNASLTSGTGPSACACDNGFYGSPDACQPCHFTCSTCTGGSTTDCTSCKSHATLTIDACHCDSGYFLDSLSAQCLPCHHTCLTCSDETEGGCTTCKASGILYSTSPSTCVCDQSSYPAPDSGTCLPCASTCLSCKDANPESCLSCKFHAVLLGGGQIGPCGCSLGFYGDASDCHICDSQCVSCTSGGFEGCSGCYPNAYLAGGVPSKCNCAEGYFPSPNASNCVPCSHGCLRCESTALCAICDSGYALISDQCSACPTNCLKCTSDFICSECIPGKHLNITGSCKDCDYYGTSLEAAVTSPYNYTYQIAFNRPIVDNLTIHNFDIRTNPESQVNWTMSADIATWIHIEGGPWSNDTLFVLEVLGSVRDEFNTSLSTRYFELPPPLNSVIIPPPTNTSTPSSTDLTVNSTLRSYSEVTSSAVVSSALISSVTAGGGGAAIQLLSSMQYFSYIASTHFSMSDEANGFYAGLSQTYWMPNFFTNKPFPSHRVLSSTDINNSDFDFLDTAGPFLSLIIVVICLHICLFLLYIGCRPRARWFHSVKNTMEWSVYFFLWCFVFLDLVIAGLVWAKRGPEVEDVRTGISAVAAVGCVMAGVGTPIAIITVLKMGKYVRKSWKFLVVSLRKEGWSKYYYAVFFIQRLLYAHFIAILTDHTQIQSLLCLIPVVLMSIFLLFIRPLHSKYANMLSIAAEINAVAVFGILCTYTMNDSSIDRAVTWVLISLTLLSFACSLGVILIIVVNSVKSWLKTSKYRSKVTPEVTVVHTDTYMEELPSPSLGKEMTS